MTGFGKVTIGALGGLAFVAVTDPGAYLDLAQLIGTLLS